MVLAFLTFLLQDSELTGPLKDLEATYHLKVEELQKPLEWQGNHYVVKAAPATASQLRAYEPTFIKEWSLYPPSYVLKAEVHRIVFGIGLSVDGQFRAAVPAFDGDTMYYDPQLGSANLHYQRIVIHHEFFHMVDQRMRSLRRDQEWAKLNAPDFQYGTGGAKMRTSGVGELTDKIPGFLTMYGTSAIEEDKAELFAHMVVDGPYVKSRTRQDPILSAKVALLQARLAKFDPAMGDDFWKKIAGWGTLSVKSLSGERNR
jgi:hypothetical protein